MNGTIVLTLPEKDRHKSVRELVTDNLAADYQTNDCLEYAEIVESLSDCIPHISNDVDHRELLAKWRHEDYK